MATSAALNAAWIVAVVSVANLAFLYLNARATREHELRMAREARDQRRLEETYLDLLTLMHQVGNWTDHLAAAPVPGPGPDAIADRAVSEMIGRVKTFASDEVYEQAVRWSGILTDFTTALMAGGGQGVRETAKGLRSQEAIVRAAVRRELSSG